MSKRRPRPKPKSTSTPEKRENVMNRLIEREESRWRAILGPKSQQQYEKFIDQKMQQQAQAEQQPQPSTQPTQQEIDQLKQEAKQLEEEALGRPIEEYFAGYMLPEVNITVPKMQQGGEIQELTDEEIADLRSQGYVVEEVLRTAGAVQQ